jgi:hypothetical protein
MKVHSPVVVGVSGTENKKPFYIKIYAVMKSRQEQADTLEQPYTIFPPLYTLLHCSY